MKLSFRQVGSLISFDSDLSLNIPFTYLIRSVLGKELKFLSCVLKQQKCSTCPLNNKCAYSVIFETPIEKNNIFLKGRNSAPPPYIINSEVCSSSKYKLSIILLGNSIEYLPYMQLALSRAGEVGLLKERIKFEIQFEDFHDKIYETVNDNTVMGNKNLSIVFKTPFRYKSEGVYQNEINLDDIINATVRRLNILSGLYGNQEQILCDDLLFRQHNIVNNLKWIEYRHYSARQGREMLLGGLVGDIRLTADLSRNVISILDGARNFHIGKSVSFGLGKVDFSLEEI